LRYPRWGGRRNAVRLEKCWGVGKGLESRQNPQRRVHALLANLPADQNLCRKKTTLQTWLNFTCNFAFDQTPKTLCEPKRLPKTDEFYFDQNNCRNEKIFYADQNACWKSAVFTFAKTFAKKRQADFWNLAKLTTNKTEATKQSQSKPPQTKTQTKNLEADFSDLTKQTWIYANEKTPPKEKAENLKTCLLKNIDPNRLLEKCHR